jgi:hypothetical protein
MNRKGAKTQSRTGALSSLKSVVYRRKLPPLKSTLKTQQARRGGRVGGALHASLRAHFSHCHRDGGGILPTIETYTRKKQIHTNEILSGRFTRAT